VSIIRVYRVKEKGGVKIGGYLKVIDMREGLCEDGGVE
jgi:hypothetical protein